MTIRQQVFFKNPALFIFILLFFNITTISAQNHTPRFNEIDIQHYIFNLNLKDDTDAIEGKAVISIKFLQTLNAFYLDLNAKSEASGKGMIVQKIKEEENEIEFQQDGKKLYISRQITAKI